MILRLLAAAVLAAGLAACAAQDVVRTAEREVVLPGKEGTFTPAQAVAEVDWSEPEIRVLRIRQNEFTPVVLSFRPGVAYVLRLENRDDSPHSFRAGEFFEAIAVKSLSPAETELADDAVLVSIKLEPGQTRELAFVPFREGYYSFDDGFLGLPLGGGLLALPSTGMFGSSGAIVID